MVDYWGLQATVASKLGPIESSDFQAGLERVLKASSENRISPFRLVTTTVILAMRYAVHLEASINYHLKPTLEDDECRKLLGL